MDEMMLVLGRSLALFCSLVLALPAGWCCMIGPLPVGCGRPVVAKTRPCCGCSKCNRQSSDRSSQPMPATPKHCPCLDRDLSTPESYRPIDANFALPAIVVIAVPVDMARERTQPVGRVAIESNTSRHILNCLWLC
jgi:hypothetical protein